MLGNPKKKNVLLRLLDLENNAQRDRVIAGEGIGITITAAGTVVSSEAQDTTAEILGAFDVKQGRLIKDKELNQYVPEDTEDCDYIRVVNSAEEELGFDKKPTTCGIMTVNNQPFEVPYFEAQVTADKWAYVYALFTPPLWTGVIADESDGTQTTEATAQIVITDEMQNSTPDAVYYLLAKVKRTTTTGEDEDGKETELKGVNIVLEHQPGELRVIWYAPCLGLLQEQPFYDADTTNTDTAE